MRLISLSSTERLEVGPFGESWSWGVACSQKLYLTTSCILFIFFLPSKKVKTSISQYSCHYDSLSINTGPSDHRLNPLKLWEKIKTFSLEFFPWILITVNITNRAYACTWASITGPGPRGNKGSTTVWFNCTVMSLLTRERETKRQVLG